MRYLRTSLVAWMILFLGYASVAQSGFADLPELGRTYVIRNAVVTVRPGVQLTGQTILLEDGLISDLGADIRIPMHAVEVEGDSLHVYAGFIAGISHIGVPPPKREDSRQSAGSDRDEIDPGNPPEKEAGITPGRQVTGLLDPEDRSISGFRQAGFTMAHTVPEGGMLPGRGALIFLDGAGSSTGIIRENISQYATLQGARRMYPSTIIAVMAKYREMFRQAKGYVEHSRLFASGGGVQPPLVSEGVKELVPAQEGSLPVYFECRNALDVHRVLQLKEDLGFRVVLSDVRQAWRIKEKVQAQSLPLLLAMDLPENKDENGKSGKESPKEKEKKEEDPEGKTPGDEAEQVDPETEALMEKRKASREMYYSQAAALERAGIAFGISLLNTDAKDFLKHLRTYHQSGLSEESALAALTTYPASLFNLEKQAGTVEKGKMANLVLFTGPFLAKDSKVRHVFVNGNLHTYKEKAAGRKGSSGKASTEVAGKWHYTIETEGGTYSGVIRFTLDGEDLKGEISSDQIDANQFMDLENVSADGTSVKFEMTTPVQGQPTRLYYTITVEGNSLSGSVSVGDFGTYPIEGERLPD